MKMFLRVFFFAIVGYTPTFCICIGPFTMANPTHKHTDLDEKGRGHADTEMRSMHQSQGQSSGVARMAPPDTNCKPVHCHEARRRHQQSPDLAGSPWHRKKTIFLIGLIVSLLVWAVIYGMLKNFDVV